MQREIFALLRKIISESNSKLTSGSSFRPLKIKEDPKTLFLKFNHEENIRQKGGNTFYNLPYWSPPKPVRFRSCHNQGEADHMGQCDVSWDLGTEQGHMLTISNLKSSRSKALGKLLSQHRCRVPPHPGDGSQSKCRCPEGCVCKLPRKTRNPMFNCGCHPQGASL